MKTEEEISGKTKGGVRKSCGTFLRQGVALLSCLPRLPTPELVLDVLMNFLTEIFFYSPHFSRNHAFDKD